MKPSSCKAKGRRHQQKIVSDILKTFTQLEPDDVTSRSMGAGGEDILFSPRARSLFPFSVEAKNVEKLNVWSSFDQACSNCGAHTPALVMKKNNTSPLCVVRWDDFLLLAKKASEAARTTPPEGKGEHHALPPLLSVPDQLRLLAERLEKEGQEIREGGGLDGEHAEGLRKEDGELEEPGSNSKKNKKKRKTCEEAERPSGVISLVDETDHESGDDQVVDQAEAEERDQADRDLAVRVAGSAERFHGGGYDELGQGQGEGEEAARHDDSLLNGPRLDGRVASHVGDHEEGKHL